MKILITGSSGFIGSTLKEFLESKKIEVIEYDIRSKPSQDVRNFQNLIPYVEVVNGIVHLAAVTRIKWAFEDPQSCIEVNIGGTENVLEAARQVGQKNSKKSPWVIFGSSREVFGEAEKFPVTEDSPKIPINVYGITKVAGEELCKVYVKDYGLRTRILRFSNVYSNSHDRLDRVIPIFIIKSTKDQPITIYGSGQKIFDFVYIEDLIHGIWQCVQEVTDTSGLKFDDFNFVTGKGTSLQKLAEIIKEETNSKSPIIYKEARSYDVNQFYGNPQKAQNILGFSPKTNLREGIRLVVKEFKDKGVI